MGYPFLEKINCIIPITHRCYRDDMRLQEEFFGKRTFRVGGDIKYSSEECNMAGQRKGRGGRLGCVCQQGIGRIDIKLEIFGI